jgi:predicted TIM-barrel fold metal-dependent hydrolase
VDDLVLLSLLADWSPNEADRTKLLVDNPSELYGF